MITVVLIIAASGALCALVRHPCYFLLGAAVSVIVAAALHLTGAA
jgi:hypothetical protein